MYRVFSSWTLFPSVTLPPINGRPVILSSLLFLLAIHVANKLLYYIVRHQQQQLRPITFASLMNASVITIIQRNIYILHVCRMTQARRPCTAHCSWCYRSWDPMHVYIYVRGKKCYTTSTATSSSLLDQLEHELPIIVNKKEQIQKQCKIRTPFAPPEGDACFRDCACYWPEFAALLVPVVENLPAGYTVFCSAKTSAVLDVVVA